ncbi:MAG: hypothetical protein J6I47_06650 [Ruminococcus sp.]|nr:hypothetical protein [Ruminococcus sp.]
MINKPKELLAWMPIRNDVPYCVLQELHYVKSDGNEITEDDDKCVYTDFIPKYKTISYYKTGKIVFKYLERMHEEIIKCQEKVSQIQVGNHNGNAQNSEFRLLSNNEVIEMLNDKKDAIEFIYESLISLINECENFETKSRAELTALRQKYHKAKHLAYLFRMIMEDSLDDGFIYEYITYENEGCLVSREESEIIQEIIDERITYKCDSYKYYFFEDYEALFIKDLCMALFSSNEKAACKICVACGSVFSPEYGNEKYCAYCNNESKRKKRAKDRKNSSQYQKNYNLLYSKANYSSNEEDQEFYNNLLHECTSEHSICLNEYIQEYGKIEGKCKEEERLKNKYIEYKIIISERKKKNAQNDETH